MTPFRITLVLTVLAAVVVVLTRVRLAKDDGAGRLSIPHALLNTHTGAGVPAVLLWGALPRHGHHAARVARPCCCGG